MTRKAIPEDSYGGRLSAAMRAAGLTNVRLAETVGVDQATVSQWRTNIFQPDEKRHEIIAAAVNRSPAWLRYGVEGDVGTRSTGGDGGSSAPAPPYPRHVEGMVKRFEADLEEAPISDALRTALAAVLRTPEQAAGYRERAARGGRTRPCSGRAWPST